MLEVREVGLMSLHLPTGADSNAGQDEDEQPKAAGDEATD
jgi:hypothetical protein